MEMKESGLVFLAGKRVNLRPLREEDFGEHYLSWLNDPTVNHYSQRRPFPVSWDGMKAYNDYYEKNPQKGFVLAVLDVQNSAKHIGNIALVNIQSVNLCAEIAILIGDKSYWGKGYASESIYLLTKHAFEALNLHKVFAGSFNPAFVRCVEKLGWTKEGEFRERIWANGRYNNQIWMSILKPEFQANSLNEATKQ